MDNTLIIATSDHGRAEFSDKGNVELQKKRSKGKGEEIILGCISVESPEKKNIYVARIT